MWLNFVPIWIRLTNDSWVLNNVMGGKIPFLDLPTQTRPPYPLKLNATDKAQIDIQLPDMLQKRDIVLPCDDQWVCNIFVRPKLNGKYCRSGFDCSE